MINTKHKSLYSAVDQPTKCLRNDVSGRVCGGDRCRWTGNGYVKRKENTRAARRWLRVCPPFTRGLVKSSGNAARRTALAGGIARARATKDCRLKSLKKREARRTYVYFLMGGQENRWCTESAPGCRVKRESEECRRAAPSRSRERWKEQ